MTQNRLTHLAVVMDGNRRWAKAHGLPKMAGHQRVADKILEALIEHAAKRGIRYMTFWAWSTENWERDKREVEATMRLFRHVIKKRWAKLNEKGVRVKVIGDISKFAPDIRKALTDVVEQTKDNKRITAVFALNYGGRDEIVRAIRKLFANIRTNGSIDEKTVTSQLDTAEIPDPDMIVRTGGECRLSGFMLWQAQYSELYFVPWEMPEFTPEKLDAVTAEYTRRQRHFGR